MFIEASGIHGVVLVAPAMKQFGVAKFFLSNRPAEKTIKISEETSVLFFRSKYSKYILFLVNDRDKFLAKYPSAQTNRNRLFVGQIYYTGPKIKFYATIINGCYEFATPLDKEEFFEQMTKCDPAIIEWMIWNQT